MFVREGIDAPVPISAMPGVVQHTLDSLVEEARRCVAAGLGGIMVFGVPREPRTPAAPAPTTRDGILNVALARLVEEVGDDLVVMADLCLDEFTDHGHCGVLGDRRVASTTTPRSSGTPRWRWPRRRPAPTCWASRG